ncbi:2,3-bisphosphoglycerate-independent phosphoglycerate mutase-like [Eucalyptus grandis]|nr:2,3-bisphosphoglycerate-independent phosphoglycerate mutase-like [Eucalyptus grandis]
MESSGFSWKLADHPKLPKGKTITMVVLDGWGEAKHPYNCIRIAETPTMDSLKEATAGHRPATGQARLELAGRSPTTGEEASPDLVRLELAGIE